VETLRTVERWPDYTVETLRTVAAIERWPNYIEGTGLIAPLRPSGYNQLAAGRLACCRFTQWR
jgi:hypothetical protein